MFLQISAWVGKPTPSRSIIAQKNGFHLVHCVEGAVLRSLPYRHLYTPLRCLFSGKEYAHVLNSHSIYTNEEYFGPFSFSPPFSWLPDPCRCRIPHQCLRHPTKLCCIFFHARCTHIHKFPVRWSHCGTEPYKAWQAWQLYAIYEMVKKHFSANRLSCRNDLGKVS